MTTTGSVGDGLLGIAFTSTRVTSLCDAEWDGLVRRAQHDNSRAGISSVLLHCNGALMQYMEGSAPVLQQVFGAIRRDRRHYGVIELFREPIASREFGDWPMLYQDAEDFFTDPTEVAEWLCPLPGSASPGRLLLSHFWKNNYRLRTQH